MAVQRRRRAVEAETRHLSRTRAAAAAASTASAERLDVASSISAPPPPSPCSQPRDDAGRGACSAEDAVRGADAARGHLQSARVSLARSVAAAATRARVTPPPLCNLVQFLRWSRRYQYRPVTGAGWPSRKPAVT